MVNPEMDYSESFKNRSAVEKDDMLRLIAEKMVTSLMNAETEEDVADDDDDDDDKIVAQLQAKLKAREKARRLKRKSRRKSTPDTRQSQGRGLEDVYHSPVRGTEKSGRPVMPPAPIEVLEPDNNILVKLKDENDSFAGGELHELVDDKHRRSSLNASAGDSHASQGKVSKSTRSGLKGDTSVFSQEFSLEELREYVMANIPLAVREQVPEEAWAQLFQVDSFASRTPSQGSRSTSPAKGKKKPAVPIDLIEFDNADENIDDVTVFSDVSGLTGAFPDGKFVEEKREMLNRASPSLAHLDEDAQGGMLDQSLRSSSEESESSGEKNLGSRNQIAHSLEKRPNTIAKMTNVTMNGAKKVSWKQVEIRYYERILSDNPSVQNGPAIGIGWRYKTGGRVDVEQWERSRGIQRVSADLVIPRDVRERVLREAGVSQKEMADMVRATLKVKNQRRQTINNLGAAGVEEAMEKARRQFKRFITLGRSKED